MVCNLYLLRRQSGLKPCCCFENVAALTTNGGRLYSFARVDILRQTVRAASSDSLFREKGYGKISPLVSVALAKKGGRLTHAGIQLYVPQNLGAMVFGLQHPWNDPLVDPQAYIARVGQVGNGDLASIARWNLEGSHVTGSARVISARRRVQSHGRKPPQGDPVPRTTRAILACRADAGGMVYRRRD